MWTKGIPSEKRKKKKQKRLITVENYLPQRTLGNKPQVSQSTICYQGYLKTELTRRKVRTLEGLQIAIKEEVGKYQLKWSKKLLALVFDCTILRQTRLEKYLDYTFSNMDALNYFKSCYIRSSHGRVSYEHNGKEFGEKQTSISLEMKMKMELLKVVDQKQKTDRNGILCGSGVEVQERRLEQGHMAISKVYSEARAISVVSESTHPLTTGGTAPQTIPV
ncbi:hypothetical protein TNCV_2565061 [Trichonephila clavipes]|uniref:Uncharacterized protein n=1 Tax=Trichonephila clavipes TaxID=2585209 RepID=A0A8X6VJZ3_TRICX|nr:hypothetical protein TNCV_2565061 [Trichonephila clavipes]